LAAVNLANMASFGTGEVDFEKLKRTVEIGVRMQDNVIDVTPYFLPENTKQAKGERRIGLGVMGLHDLLIKCGLEYGSEEGNQLVDKIFETIACTAYRASIELAKEKGSFPFLTTDDKLDELDLRMKFVNTGYMKKMPEDIRKSILKHGIRNSHLLTVAPTGSTGTMIGGSTGLEPYFSFVYYRSGRLGKFIEVKAPIVEEYLKFKGLPLDTPLSELPSYFKGAMDLTPEQHADVQCIIQRWVDSSLSKTVNAPKEYTVKQVEAVYERLWRGGAKGGTVYVDGSRDAQVLSLSAEENNIEELDVNIKEITATPEQPVEKIYATIDATSEPEVVYGSEVGNTCPICKAGIVQDFGGCNSCTNCGAQLKCGL
jgi:ribonucleoside-diphosphate reductase alpha chain